MDQENVLFNFSLSLKNTFDKNVYQVPLLNTSFYMGAMKKEWHIYFHVVVALINEVDKKKPKKSVASKM